MISFPPSLARQNLSLGSNRVIAQQCGQVLLKAANEISKHFGGSFNEFTSE